MDLQRACVDIPIADVVARVHEAGATHGVVLHNHVCASGWPSRADLDSTVQLRTTLGGIGITLDDSIIVAGAETVSFSRLETDLPYRERVEARFRSVSTARAWKGWRRLAATGVLRRASGSWKRWPRGHHGAIVVQQNNPSFWAWAT